MLEILSAIGTAAWRLMAMGALYSAENAIKNTNRDLSNQFNREIGDATKYVASNVSERFSVIKGGKEESGWDPSIYFK